MLQEIEIADGAPLVSPAHANPICARGLEVRLATTPAEIDAAQALRYSVLYEERGVAPPNVKRWRRRDFDVYDDVADHLIILHHGDRTGAAGVIGACRLIRGRKARTPGAYLPAPGFCASAAFDIEPLLQCSGEIVELGRACIEQAYRDRSTVELMWQGIAAYLHAFNVGTVFGCASFHGTNPAAVAEPLSLLYQRRMAPPHLRPRAHIERYIPMSLIPGNLPDERRAIRGMPPLVKGFLRMGATFGDGAVIDHEFGTVDVCAVLPAAQLTRQDRPNRRFRIGDSIRREPR